MATHDKTPPVEIVHCDLCLKEVPVSGATVPEAADYFVHFCGLECYEQWKRLGGKPQDKLEKPGK